MIQIPMNPKGSIDRSSMLTINNTRNQAPLSARNITALNRPSAQNAAHAPAQSAVHTPPASRSTAPASAATAAASPRKKLPAFAKPVQKGQKIPLYANGQVPGVIKACFGWNTSNPKCDADVSAFLLGADGKVIGDSWFVFYGQTQSPDRSVLFAQSQGADREIITADLSKLNKDVKKIVFVLTINEAFANRLHFGMMEDAYVRILDARGAELTSFQMTEYYSNVISMMICEIYQYNGSWKFNAVGNGVAKDLAGLCALYGVEVV